MTAAAPAAAERQVSLLADPAFQARAESGLAELYAMRFAAADAEFAAIAGRHPDHPVGPFLGALTTWWRILRDPADTSHDARLLAAMEEALARADRRLERDRHDVDGKFFRGAALAFRGRLRSMRGEWLPAAYDCKRALKLVREVVEDDPRNADLYFGIGLYDYFGEVLPERYPLLRPATLFLPAADRQRGIARLTRVARDGRYVQTEAAWFLLQIQFFFERDYRESLRWSGWLRRTHPGNSLFHEMHGRVLLAAGRTAEARREFETVLERLAAGSPAYTVAQAERAHYSLAVAAMRRGDHRQALRHLESLDALTARRDDDVPLRVLGRLRRGMCFDALGKRSTAVALYRQVLAMDDSAGAHDRAKELLQRPYRPGTRDDQDDETAVEGTRVAR
ncbi:MAG TPA: tetratricopeptide repeat protein [Thermoanaerobaculia bacterium]|nr:tetratricopeptide repeat protein [Thermoanaerobaculia bacterium]